MKAGSVKIQCLGLALPLIVFALFWRVGSHGFVNLDSLYYVTGNGKVQSGLSLENLYWALQSTDMSNWHPLTWLSYMLDVQLFGISPSAMHRVNVVMHAINAELLFLLLVLSTKKTWPSFLVACLFAIHPGQVESVAWIAERKDVLFCFFFILGLIVYSRYRNNRTITSYIALIMVFCLGLMSKAMMVTFPFALILIDYCSLSESYKAERFSLNRFLSFLPDKLPLIFLTLLVCLINFRAQKEGGAMVVGEAFSLVDRIENSIVAYAFYIKQAIAPSNLSLFYPHPGKWPFGTVVVSLLVVAAVLAVAILQRRSNPPVFFGVMFFFGTLVPVIGLVQVGLQAYADRYTYLPYVGLFIAACFGMAPIVEKLSRFLIVKSATVVLLLVFCWQTSQYLSAWKDSISIWSYSLMSVDPDYISIIQGKATEEPKDARQLTLSFPYIMMGIALLENGQLDLGLVHLERAKQLGMIANSGWYWHGRALLESGNTEEALASFDIFEKLNPRDEKRRNIIRELREAHVDGGE